MSILKILFSIFIFSISIDSSNGQFEPIKNFGVGNGLPSSETYSINQDSKFRYWICTDNGVSLFNGNSFVNFSVNNGLPTNTIFSSFENKITGTIWFITYGFGVCFFNESSNSFMEPVFNKKLIKIFNNKFINHCEFDKFNNLWITYGFTEYLKIDKNGLITIFPSIPILSNVSFEIIKANELYLVRGNKNAKSTGELKLIKQSNGNYNVSGISTRSFSSPNIVKMSDSKLIISIEDDLYIINNKTIFKKKLPSRILYISKDPNNYLWIGTEKKGIFTLKFINEDIEIKNVVKFEDISITSILVDKNKKVWISSLTTGIYCIQNTNISNYLKNKKLDFIFNQNNKLSFISFGGKIYYEPNKKNQLLTWHNKSEIKDLKVGPNKKLYICKSIYLKEDPKILDLNNIPFWPIGFLNKSVLFGGKNGIVEYDYQNRFLFKTVVPSPIFKLCPISDTSLLVGCLNGLYIFINHTFSAVKGPTWLATVRINNIKKQGDSYYILTDGKGILKYKDQKITVLNLGSNTSFNSGNCIDFENDSIAWIGSNQGVLKIKVVQNKILALLKLTTTDGLPSNEVNDIKSKLSKLFIATNNGLCVFNTTLNTSTKISPLFFSLMVGNFRDTLFTGYQRKIKLTLDKRFRNLYLKFLTNRDINNKIIGLIRYRVYRNEKLLNNWTLISDNNLQFTNLDPGDYKIDIKVTDPILNEVFYSTAHFEILPFFFERTWVRVLLIFAILLIIGLSIIFVIKKLKYDAEIKRQMIDAEIKSLRNQMNPHFIFNALNSIQNFIFQNNQEKASRFLSKFSTLIRKSLELSKLNFITIRAEIEFIEEYLEIEKLRFGKKFNYSIEIDKGLNVDNILIPPLLMQPLIENSIKHAFVNNKDNGMILIKLHTNKTGIITYAIKDNGIGIQNKKKETENYKTSLSHGILIERFQLLREMEGNSSQIGMVINNLVFENSYGTEIILKLPIKHV